jgi:hypothetical protein
MTIQESLTFILPALVFYALVMWLALGRIPHSLLLGRLATPIIFILVLIASAILFAGVFSVLLLYGIVLGMVLGVVRLRHFVTASRRVVILGTGVVIITLIGGSLWFWGYYGHEGALRASFSGDFDEFMREARTAGRMVYLLPAVTGMLAAVIATLFSKAPLAQSLALASAAILVLIASPLLLWFDFITSCMVGDAVFITWSTLC